MVSLAVLLLPLCLQVSAVSVSTQVFTEAFIQYAPTEDDGILPARGIDLANAPCDPLDLESPLLIKWGCVLQIFLTQQSDPRLQQALSQLGVYQLLGDIEKLHLAGISWDQFVPLDLMNLPCDPFDASSSLLRRGGCVLEIFLAQQTDDGLQHALSQMGVYQLLEDIETEKLDLTGIVAKATAIAKLIDEDELLDAFGQLLMRLDAALRQAGMPGLNLVLGDVETEKLDLTGIKWDAIVAKGTAIAVGQLLVRLDAALTRAGMPVLEDIETEKLDLTGIKWDAIVAKATAIAELIDEGELLDAFGRLLMRLDAALQAGMPGLNLAP